MGLWKEALKIVITTVTIGIGAFLISLEVRDYILQLLSNCPPEYSTYVTLIVALLLIIIGLVAVNAITKKKKR